MRSELSPDWHCLIIQIIQMTKELVQCVCLRLEGQQRDEGKSTYPHPFYLICPLECFDGAPSLPLVPLKIVISDPW